MPETILQQLKKIIEAGILNDLMKTEEAISVFKAIAKNATEINKSELYVKSSFAYIQLLSFNDLILSINRLYDRSSERNQTRCIESALKLLKEHHNQLPPIVEKYNTIETLRHYKIPEHIVKLVDSSDEHLFAYKLAVHLENRLINHRDQLVTIKRKRDKTLAHNEPTSVISIKLDEIQSFLNFGWEVLIIIGWAYFSTIYGTKDDNHLIRDAHSKGFYINKLIQNNLKQNSA
jgi:hypothetical protein